MAARKTPAKKAPASKVVDAVRDTYEEVQKEVDEKQAETAKTKLVEFVTVKPQSAAFRVNGVGKVWNPRIRLADNRLVFKVPEDELEAFTSHIYIKNGIVVPLKKD